MRAITRWCSGPRAALIGFRLMNMRPKLTAALNGEAPIEDPTAATAGSARTTFIALSCSAFIASKEMSGEASVPPKISPVSSCGK